jgi:hypothetical protein
MTIWKRWIQRSVLCGLLLGGLVAFATVASAEGMPPVTDHAAMASWYDKEAANLRQNEKAMKATIEEYRKNPKLLHSATENVPHKVDAVAHCESLIKYYAKAAEEAEFLAGGHRGMMK